MRLKFKTREDKLSELSQYLPDGDFIAVFGTSHTSGVCKRGDSEAISREDIWAEQVGAALGLPVFNASMPGNDNDTIVQQMIDFLDVPGARERCKRVICELRIAEGTTRMSRDLLGDFGVFRRAEFVPQLTNCYSVPAKTVVDPEDGGLVGHTTITDKLLVRLPTSFKRQDKKRQYQLLLDMLPDIIDTPAPSMYDVVMDVLDNFINYENISMLPFIKDYNFVKTMNAIWRWNGIPFNWFCWDEHAQFGDPTDDFKVVRSAFKQVTDVFDTEVKLLAGSAHKHCSKSLPSDTKFSDFNCECGHQNEVMHKFVAEQIIKEIQNV
jgi:hypothetical protein